MFSFKAGNGKATKLPGSAVRVMKNPMTARPRHPDNVKDGMMAPSVEARPPRPTAPPGGSRPTRPTVPPFTDDVRESARRVAA